MAISSTLAPVNRTLVVADNALYIEALDFLNRAKTEGKDNEVNLEIFTTLYGTDIAAKLAAEGYFNSNSN